MNTASISQRRPVWPHRWAWLLACAIFPLICFGGQVTTTNAGMAFKDGINSDGYFVWFYPWFSAVGDKFVEHGHRLLGYVVGFLVILLVIAIQRRETRVWVRRYSWLILAGVILQGVLGAMRVHFDERTFALIHGCTGPAFFAMCVGMVVVTSQWWQDVAPVAATDGNRKFFRIAVTTTMLAYLQLVAGAFVRHSPHLTSSSAATIFRTALYFHILLALAITVHAVLINWQAYRNGIERGRSAVLAALVVLQVLLGASTWMVKYGLPQWAASIVGDMSFLNTANSGHQSGIVTTHMAVGSLILITTLAIAIRAGRQLRIGLPRLNATGVRLEVAL
jgi:cytochrome c oxidase assembly protein subunit 15